VDKRSERQNDSARTGSTDHGPERRERAGKPGNWAWHLDDRRATTLRTPRRRLHSRAFSLLEMMIAVVILGLGLVMVATMFPIAWGRARKLVEYTSQAAVTEATHASVNIMARVPDAPSVPGGVTAGSFAGDLSHVKGVPLVMPDASGNLAADTRVHVYQIENLLLSEPRRFVPQRVDPWDEEFAPWKLEIPGGFATLGFDPAIECDPDPTIGDERSCYASFLASQVPFESRVYPPMRAREHVDEAGLFEGPDRAWDNELDTRRYAWAVLHRLREPPLATNLEAKRNFDLYYVTLRRPQVTHRYARQDPKAVPDPNNPAVVVKPVALPANEDVMFSSPWRVQILFPADPPSKLNPVAGNPVTGLPSEIEVNATLAKTAGFVIDMFQVGTPFIDEVNGRVYNVTRLRYTDDKLEAGILTLDREVLFEDMDYQPLNPGTIAPGERIRTVWVFPPPVQADRAGASPVFDGGQPVVGIDVRALSISPKRK